MKKEGGDEEARERKGKNEGRVEEDSQEKGLKKKKKKIKQF